MTLEQIDPQNYRLLRPCECVDLYEIGEVPSLYSPVTPEIQPLDWPVEKAKEMVPEPRRQAFDHLLGKLHGKQFIGMDYAEEYLRDQYRRGCRANTMRSSSKGIELFLNFLTQAGKMSLDQIVREDLYGFIEREQDRGLKPRTVDTRLKAVKAFLRFLIDQELVHHRLLSRRITVKVPESLPRAIDPDEVGKLLSVIKHVRNRAMILVLLRTGMRIGELLNTKVGDVNLKERRIEIFEAEKNRVGRVVYLSDDALSALSRWYKKRDSHKDFVFYAMGRRTMTYQGARAMFNKYLAEAGLADKGYSLHCLRHTFASELLNAGMRLECVQQLLGHSCIEMTRRYARLTDKTREEEYFRAMSIIEKGEIDGHYRFDNPLQAVSEKTQLFSPHSEELHEHP
ncbi:MAG: tyrosine-type recombinase/integrase [Desulfobacterales bacterium]|nr:tyrosine-type recombinase/integrase [Desulfobacterales bacterium]